MFSLIMNSAGNLQILAPNEKFKVIDNRLIDVTEESDQVLLKSYNCSYLEKTKRKLSSQVKIVLNSDMMIHQLVQEEEQDATETDGGIVNIDSLFSSQKLAENQSEEACSENGEEAEEHSSNSDDDSSSIFSDEEYMTDESELDVESAVDSDDEVGYESSDSLMEQLRDDHKIPTLPKILVSPISSIHEGFASSSLVQNSSQCISDNIAEDPTYVPESVSNISAEMSRENTNSNNEAASKTKIDPNIVRKIIDDNIEKYIENTETPDYETVIIDPIEKNNVQAPRKRKLHECFYCGKDQSHLKRHLLRKHKNELGVQLMKNSSANLKGSRKPMKELLFAGDLKHNTDKTKFTGKFRVSRLPKLGGRKVTDYSACPRCKAMILEVEFRKHVTVCAEVSGKNCRNLKYLGRKYMKNCHPRASAKMRKQILCRMRNDKVLRAVKYDALLVEFGNEICEHLRGSQHKANICSKLRRLGRLKLAMKVEKFEDILISGKSLSLVKTIELMASDKDNPDCEFLKYPTLAENVATLVKQVAKTHKVLCLRNNEKEIRESTIQFLECFENDYRTRLSRMVSESHGKYRRGKVVELPSAEVIKKLYAFLSEVRKTHYNSLECEFSQSSYLELLKSTLTSLQVFNSRRPGDVERIFLSEYQNRQQIPKEQGLDCDSLPEELRDLASEFSLLHSRGKWSNDIKFLVPPDVQLCINKLIDLRPQMQDISPKNQYLFALPRTPLAEIRHPSAYVLLSRYAERCGAEKPKALRSTGFRKNLATRCIELNLNDAELTDLAAYMGHHVDIHKSHYRRNIVTRDIPLFLKFVSKAVETKQPKNTSDSDTDESDKNDSVVESPHNSVSETTQYASHEIANESESIASSATSDDRQNGRTIATCTKSAFKSVKNKKSKNSPTQVGTISRPRWSTTEIKIIYRDFKDFFNGKSDSTPAEKIKRMMDENPNHFTGRTIKAIRTWMHIRKKRM